MRWALILVLGMLPAGALGAELNGRALFHGFTPFAAGLSVTAQRLPAEMAACAACHGRLGEGGSEGGLKAPPVRWTALTTPRAGQPALAGEGAIVRAITDGVGRAGPTHPAMPHYRLTADERDALLSYLQVVGTSADLPPGVTSASIAIGTVLPLSGPGAAIGQAVLAGLHDVFDAPNAGSVHGRRLEIEAADSVPNGAAAAAAVLVAKPVFAVVAGLWRADDRAADEVLASHRITHVASLIVRRTPGETGQWSADLLPPSSEQDAALAGALATCSGTERIAVGRSGRIGMDAAGIEWVQTTPVAPRRAAPGCIGTGLGTLGPALAAAPPGWRVHVVLPMPGRLAQAGDAWRQLGRAAAQLLLEALARSGSLLHERSLLAHLPGLSGFEPLPGLPVRFSRQRRFAWDPALADLDGAAPNRAAPPFSLQ